MFRLSLVMLLMGPLSLWLGSEALRAIRTGIANAGGTLISGRSRPWAFWGVIAVQVGFVVTIMAVLLRLVRQALVS